MLQRDADLGEMAMSNTEREALIDEVIEHYDGIVAKAPLDDAERDFVMTAAEYRIITGAYTKLRAELAALREQKPFAWQVVQKDGSIARNGFSYERSEDLVTLADVDWPANAPHRTIPLYASPPAPDAETVRVPIEMYRWATRRLASEVTTTVKFEDMEKWRALAAALSRSAK